MLRVVVNNHPSAAKRYYTAGLSTGDYYLGEPSEAGTWGGKASERLGLRGEVGREEFFRLCENKLPNGVDALTERTKANRRVGYDLNFHPPKSVSVLYAVTSDARIREAFREAVADSMRLLEGEARTRVRLGGESSDRVTGNLLWATFIHDTARPVAGIPDPHLHAHCFTFNATHDDVENRWKAAQFGEIKKHAPLFEAAFHASLAGRLTGLGYGIEHKSKGWEVRGVPQSAIDKFSRRTAEVEAFALKRGITDPEGKAAVGARTRRSKGESLPANAVREHWQKSLSLFELAQIKAARVLGARFERSLSPTASIDHALAKCLERSSVVSEKKVMAEALRFGLGSVSFDAVKNELATRTLIRKESNGEVLVSTPEVLDEERRMLSFARDGRGSCRPFASLAPDLSKTKLNADQQAAVTHIVSSTDRVMLIRGKAGTGKTTLMQEAVSRIEASGRSVFVFAPTGDAARGVLRKEGFEKAETVAKLLGDSDWQKAVKHQVIWVDEAGLLGTRSMKKLFDVADKQNARVILSGDTGQHRSVERGDAMRLLEREAGLGVVTLREIQRQKGEYKSAVNALSEGRVADGYARLDRLGAIREVKPKAAHDTIAEAYVGATQKRKSALIVSPTHAEGARVTDAVRSLLKVQNVLRKEKTFERLERVDSTEAERRSARFYKKGMVVEFHKNAKGFKAGSRYEVMGRDPFGNVLARKGLWFEALPLKRVDRFDVYDRSKLQIAKGETIRITRNARIKSHGLTGSGWHRVENGTLQRVKGFTLAGDVKLANGWVIPKDFGHLSHGYCVTSHASQGKTVDRVFVAQSVESFRASSAEQFYVSASRAREQVTIFTDDKIKLLEAVQKSGARLSATELAAQGTEPGRGPVKQAREPIERDEDARQRENGRER